MATGQQPMSISEDALESGKGLAGAGGASLYGTLNDALGRFIGYDYKAVSGYVIDVDGRKSETFASVIHKASVSPERLIGTLRRDCLDHVLVFGAQHLRQILTSYSSYYNKTRTHLSLDKDAPLRRAVERCGTIVATPILSGLHHQYARI
jgi:hypothetical protein